MKVVYLGMAKSKKEKEKPVVINASFEELVKMSVAGNPAPKPKEKKEDKKKDKKKPAPNDLENYQELNERELGGEG